MHRLKDALDPHDVFAPGRLPRWDELLRAAESSLGFWDNPQDDEDWNDA